MESKIVDFVLKATEAKRNAVNEMPEGDRKVKTEEEYRSKEAELKRNYEAIKQQYDRIINMKKTKKVFSD